MFSGTEQMKIWSINRDFAGRMEEGKNDNPYIPTMEKLREQAIKELQEKGFSVEDAERCDANCIIRIYRHTSMALPDAPVFVWMYGVEAYIKNWGCYRSEPVGKKFDYTKQNLTIFHGSQSKYTKVSLYAPCFQDFFVKLTVQ